MNPNAEKSALKIIKLLEGRGGFDEWWDQVTAKDRREILDAIEDAVWEAWGTTELASKSS